MLDDLRRASADDDDFEDSEENDPFAEEEAAVVQPERYFLGMTAVERMFLSIFLFMTTFVLGLAFLVATNRIAF
ncbi:MAG: hypothetical protein ACUVSX_10905 [Aggregatilineales bacterium]